MGVKISFPAESMRGMNMNIQLGNTVIFHVEVGGFIREYRMLIGECGIEMYEANSSKRGENNRILVREYDEHFWPESKE
jgi:hypothetical protein